MSDPRRRLPSVESLLANDVFEGLLEEYPRTRVVAAIRGEIDDVRTSLSQSGMDGGDLETVSGWVDRVSARLAREDVPSLRRVINATGVVLHTNLGRAPLAAAAVRAMAAASGYANLEYDLGEGVRGSRYDHCVDLLRERTGAADALVVNNCAAALLLALNTVAAGRGVVVSRGELVEIGGGFRVPEIMERSGARLIEVGSTNRTRAQDYRAALATGGPAALLKVHRSNFRISGFTEDVAIGELAALAAEFGVPLIHDLGSGLMDDPGALGLPDEPRPSTSLRDGSDLVVVSGDKLLGGPQAGLLLGSEEHIAALRGNPMCRALRVDKVTLAGLEATLRLYRDPATARSAIPTLRMLSIPLDKLEERARSLAAALEPAGPCHVAEGVSAVGGGTYPGVELPSWTVRIPVRRAGALLERLRRGDPPVVARVEDGEVVLDMRTIAPAEVEEVVRRVSSALSQPDESAPDESALSEADESDVSESDES